MSNQTETATFLMKTFRVERRALMRHSFRNAMLAAALTLVCLALLDVTLPFSPTGLRVVQGGILLMMLLLAALLIRKRLRIAYRPARVAVRVQQRLGISRDRLINSLQLAGAEDAATSEAFREKAVELGEACARDLSPGQVLDKKQLRRSWWAILVLVCMAGGVQWMWPGFWGMTALRFMDPDGLHPPYTRLRFEVLSDPNPAYAGGDIRLIARITGPALPDEAALWLRSADRESPVRRFGMTSGQASAEMSERRFSYQLQKVTEPLEVSVNTKKGRSRWQKLTPLPVPRIRRAVSHITYPDYTGWSPETGEMHSTDLEGIAGSTARLELTCTLPIEYAEVSRYGEGGEIVHEETVFPDPSNPNMFRVPLPLETSGVYRIRLQGLDGTPGDQEWLGRLIVREDQRPQVSVGNVGLDGVVYAGWEIPIEGRAHDDVGLAEGRVMVRVNENPGIIRPIDGMKDLKDARVMDLRETLPLDEVGALPGSQVSYLVEVRDNLPPDGQWSSTKVATLQVVSKEAYEMLATALYSSEQVMQEILNVHEELRRLKEERNALLERLTAMRKIVPAGTRPDDQQIRDFAEIRRELSDYIRNVSDLQTWIDRRLEYEVLYAFEEPYRKWLNDLDEGLEGQTRDAAAVQDAWVPDPSFAPWNEPFDRAEQTFRDNTVPYPPDLMEMGPELAEDIETLQKLAEVMWDTQRLQQLEQDQRDLLQRLEMMNSRPQADPEERPSALESAGQEQKRLQEDLSQLKKEMQRHAEEIREQFPDIASELQGLADGIQNLGIVQVQGQGAQAASKGQGGRAEENAREAADKLAGLLGPSENLAGQCERAAGQCQSMSGSQASDSIQQMLNALQMGQGGRPPMDLPFGLRLGGAGAGMGGQLSTLGMVGPQFPTMGGNISGQALPGRRAGEAPGATGETGVDTTEDPGTVVPEKTFEELEAITLPAGIPHRFQPVIRAYFDRLSSDRFEE